MTSNEHTNAPLSTYSVPKSRPRQRNKHAVEVAHLLELSREQQVLNKQCRHGIGKKNGMQR